MRGLVKKDKLLVAIIIVVLCVALIQLAALIYKSYNTLNGENEELTVTINDQEACSIQVLNNNIELELDSKNSCVIKEGTEIEIKIKPNEHYGVYNITLNNEKIEVSVPYEFNYKFTVEEDTLVNIEIKKIYLISYQSFGTGKGDCTFEQDQERVSEKEYIFEDESLSLIFLPEDYSEIKWLQINKEDINISETQQDRYIYRLDKVDRDIVIKVSYEKKKFTVEVEDKDFDIWMNDKKTNKVEIEANQNCNIKISCKNPNQVITSICDSDKNQYWSEENCTSLEYNINNVKKDIRLFIRSKYYSYIKLDFKEIFKIILENNSDANIKKIISSSGNIKVIFNEKKKLILTTIGDWYITNNDSYAGKENIEASTTSKRIYLRNNSTKDEGIYQYPIQFIFDTISPTISSYKVTRPAPSLKSPDITISSQITDQGDSDLDTVQFGTKEDYDKAISAEETQKKYNYKLQNESSDYQFTIQKTSLKDEEYYIWATDNATNRSEAMKVDVAGPTLTIETESKWSNQDITVKGITKDKGSSVEQVYYSTDQNQAENHMSQDNETKNIKRAALNKETGEYSFSVKADQSGKKTYYVWAYDTLGNKSEEIYKFEALLDVKKPVMQLVEKKPNKKWHNDVVTISFSAKDYDKAGCSGIQKVYYSIGSNQKDMTELTVNKDENDSYVIQSPIDENKKALAMEGSYYIYAEDKAGNRSEPLQVEVNIDIEPAKVTGVRLSKKVGESTEEVRSLRFGTYLNEPLLVEVTASDLYQLKNGDMTKASGIKSVMLLCNGKQVAIKNCDQENYKDEFKVIFQIPIGTKGSFSLMTCDQVGNQSTPVSISKVNSSYTDYICIEKGTPKLKISCDTPTYTDTEKKAWYSKDEFITFDCDDSDAGLKQIEVKVNGQAVMKDLEGNDYQINDRDQKIEEATFKINTQQIGESEDGHYEIQLTAIDNAGNKETKTRTIYIDRTTPVIQQFSFTANGIKDRDERLIEKQEYGYYFNEPTKVQIKASDGTPSSGIRAIEYYTVDYSSSKEGVTSKKSVKEVGEDDTVSFTIQQNFKGQIFARAIDYVEHTASKFSKPYGIIIDSSAGGVTNSQIAFETPETECKDNKGNKLYKENINAKVEVANYYSGIRSVEWEVDSKQDSANNQSGKLTVSASGQLEGNTSDFSLEESDKNLVTRLQGNLVIANNSNDVRIHVVVTDRTGAEYEKEMYLSIDKTRPSIELTFDKHNSGVYYNQPRVATIKVKERNFDPAQVKLELFNAAGEVPVLSAWSKQENTEDPNQTVNIATITFDKDGIYSIKVMAKDKVGNEAETSQTETFTIDQTRPELEVIMPSPAYKEASVNYYNTSTKVRINIEEDNFDFSNVQVSGTATNEGKQIPFPKLEIISSSRKQYNLEIEFMDQGSYTFSIAYVDQAGNALEKQEAIHLVIDKVSPEIKITGVKDEMSYNGDFLPEITCTDGNFTNSGTNVKLYDAMGKEIDITPVKVKATNGVTYRLDCFPKKKEYDKIYKLVVSSTDKASNVTAKEIHFSINRFGSTYSFSDSLLNVSGKYVKDEFDLIVTEINVNKLSKENTVVRLICNDMVKDLVRDQDYSVTESGGKGTWYEYQYKISSQLIKEDGKYSLAIYSKDEAGNINENTDEGKKAEIWFGIDRTAPRIVPINVAAGSTYNETRRAVKISVEDNLVLDGAKIYVNDQEVSYSLDQDQYVIQVGSSNSAQNIKIVARDQAGNEATKEIRKIFITTNLFVRIANDRSFLVIGVVGVIIITFGAGIVFLIYRRKKKPEHE